MSHINSDRLRNRHMLIVVSNLVKGICRESAEGGNCEFELTINGSLIEVTSPSTEGRGVSAFFLRVERKGKTSKMMGEKFQNTRSF